MDFFTDISFFNIFDLIFNEIPYPGNHIQTCKKQLAAVIMNKDMSMYTVPAAVIIDFFAIAVVIAFCSHLGILLIMHRKLILSGETSHALQTPKSVLLAFKQLYNTIIHSETSV